MKLFNNRNQVFLFFVALFFCFSGCRKNDINGINEKVDFVTLQKQFFNTESTNDVEIKNLAKDIKRQDSIFKFLPAFIQKNGMPKWDKVLYKTKNKNGNVGKTPTLGNNQVSTFTENSNNTASQGVFFIPLQSTTSSEIKSYITAYKHNDSLYTYRLYNKDSLGEVHTTNAQEKSNLLNTEAVFGYFEKSVNNKDSVTIGSNGNKTVIKNANITINEKSNSSIKNLTTTTLYAGGSCDITFEIAIIYYQVDYYINGNYVGSQYGVEIYMSITISCSGGGGGDCGCGNPGGGIGNPSGGNGDPNGGYDPNNPGGGNWWNSGTGWPWNNPYYYAGYDPNNPNPYNPGWGWWWNGGGGMSTPIQNFINSLSSAQASFWNNQNNISIVSFLENILNQSNFSIEKQEFVKWAIDYFSQHPTTDLNTFKNQFLSISEGEDGSYDNSYWDDPNLTFPPQNLPSWNLFSTAYPKHNDPLYDTPNKMYNSVGGQVLNLYNSNPLSYQNTCALRISKALNYSGITIPSGPDRYQGADGKYYFVSAAALLKWMKKTFGVPTGSNHLTGSQGGTNGENFPTLLSGKKGIYIMTPNFPGGCSTGTGFCASGHADMIDNSICDGGCYFNATGGVGEIFIWELP